MGAVNHLAVLATVVVQMAIGFAWYAEWAFGGIWMEGIGLDPATMGAPEAHVFPIAILGSFAIGYAMAGLLGRLGIRGAISAAQVGAVVGALLVGMTLAVHHAFSGHSIPVMLVDAAKEVVTFALVAAVLGGWPAKDIA